jgi:hypothetical protein
MPAHFIWSGPFTGKSKQLMFTMGPQSFAMHNPEEGVIVWVDKKQISRAGEIFQPYNNIQVKSIDAFLDPRNEKSLTRLSGRIREIRLFLSKANHALRHGRYKSEINPNTAPLVMLKDVFSILLMIEHGGDFYDCSVWFYNKKAKMAPVNDFRLMSTRRAAGGQGALCPKYFDIWGFSAIENSPFFNKVLDDMLSDPKLLKNYPKPGFTQVKMCDTLVDLYSNHTRTNNLHETFDESIYNPEDPANRIPRYMTEKEKYTPRDGESWVQKHTLEADQNYNVAKLGLHKICNSSWRKKNITEDFDELAALIISTSQKQGADDIHIKLNREFASLKKPYAFAGHLNLRQDQVEFLKTHPDPLAASISEDLESLVKLISEVGKPKNSSMTFGDCDSFRSFIRFILRSSADIEIGSKVINAFKLAAMDHEIKALSQKKTPNPETIQYLEEQRSLHKKIGIYTNVHDSFGQRYHRDFWTYIDHARPKPKRQFLLWTIGETRSDGHEQQVTRLKKSLAKIPDRYSAHQPESGSKPST